MRPGTNLVGPFGLVPEAKLGDFLAVAHRGVDHHARDAQLNAGVHHDRAHQRARGIALAVDDQHVTRFRELHGGVDHEVVARAHLDSERRSRKSRLRRDGGNAPIERAAAARHIRED